MKKIGSALHWIAVGCVVFWGLNLLVHVRTPQIQAIAGPILWLALAYVLFRWPRRTGVWLGLLMLGVVALQYRTLSGVLADPQYAKTIGAADSQHVVRFWLSVVPLVVGGLCSLPLRWMPERLSSVHPPEGETRN